MNTQAIKSTSAAIVAAAFLACSFPAPAAEVESATAAIPGGGVAVESIKLTATIKSIDAKTRNVTLVTDDGETETFAAGPAVVNFDKLAAGDKVNVTVTEAVAVFLGSDAEASADSYAKVSLAPVGGTPGGEAVAATQITAKITKLDAKKRRATLELPDGEVRKVKVREGIDLSKVAVGDTVTIAIAIGVAVDVEKP